jgi:hypothetical protein
MTDPFITIINSMYDHVNLLEAGLSNEQALRIAFDDKADVALDNITSILLEQNEIKQRQMLEDFWK